MSREGWDRTGSSAVHAVADAGADAVEIGIPFSDPMIDGPIVQEASLRALDQGTTPTAVLDALAAPDLAVPLCVMTYYNIVFRAGLRRFARSLADAGVAGAIIPDLPLEEAEEWCVEADDAGIATILLVAPSTPATGPPPSASAPGASCTGSASWA